MTPLKLYLKGFSGIRNGLGQSEVMIDLDAAAGDAQLVALVGSNGSGKTTIIDNLHPFRIMPSRSTSYSVAGFSYYDHLCAAEAVKDLEWLHEGERYRSQIVLRVNGTRKTEAYLHRWQDGKWTAVHLADGTCSDGKSETYDRCVEDLLGSPEAFFTSVFSAQNRRPLSSYKTGEIKSLMVELLQLDRIRGLGEEASRVTSLLKLALDEKHASKRELDQIGSELSHLRKQEAAASALVDTTQVAKDLVVQAAEKSHARVQGLIRIQESKADSDRRRAQLESQIGQTQSALTQLATTTANDANRVQARKERMERDQQVSLELLTRQKDAREAEMHAAQALVSRADEIEEAYPRIALLEQEEISSKEHVAALRQQAAVRVELQKQHALLQAQHGSLEREAGAVAIRAQQLRERFGLTAAVPCQGTDLQARCKLLSDAREAKTLMPSAEADIGRIRGELAHLTQQQAQVADALNQFSTLDSQLVGAERQLEAIQKTRRDVSQLVSLKSAVDDAQSRLTRLAGEIRDIDRRAITAREAAAREALSCAAELAEISARAERDHANGVARLNQFQQELSALPVAFELNELAQAREELDRAQRAVASAESDHIRAVQEQAQLAACIALLTPREASALDAVAELGALEAEVGWWTLLAKGLSNDGVIALCIDDAGPELARLTNELLLSCYGPRFTVSITTQVETAKKDLREGFDVIVFDADSGESKSVTVMSGGEKVWLNECLTRAIAIYLTQASGRRYQTLFSDEADGPLDLNRKRMFIAMKRAVLNLGGYQREFFVTQTPELWELADRVIDVGALATA